MNAPFLFVDQVATAGKTCLVRLDLNVPLVAGQVGDDTRIRRILPGLEALRDSGARIVILTHLGRPKGKVVPEMSVAPVAAALGAMLGCEVPVEADITGAGGKAAVAALADGGVLMMENLRSWVRRLSEFAPVAAAATSMSVMLSCTHRAHARSSCLHDEGGDCRAGAC